jgi:DNA end-binding protein Ku
MRFAHEIQPQQDLDLPGAGKWWTDKEMKLARQLMDTLSGDWDLSEHRDTYTEVVRQIITAKVEGKTIVAPELPTPARVVNLMDALRQSLKVRSREPAKVPARHAAARRRVPAGRRSAA